MLAINRKKKICDIVLSNKSGTVAELSKLFNVSEETIRRDLKQLEEEGVLVRTHGGAYVQDSVTNEVNISTRENLFVENKRAIAKKCAQFILKGDSIFLDCSTTAYAICDEIINMDLIVLTNSLKIINRLSESRTIEVYSTGGQLSLNSMSFLGRGALQSLTSFHVDKAFISCDAINLQYGLMDANERQADIRELAASHAKRVYLIADHTKFDGSGFMQFGEGIKIEGIIVDEPLDAKWVSHFEKKGIALHVCNQ